MALYLQAVTLLESMVTDPWKEGYCVLTPSLANGPVPPCSSTTNGGPMDSAESRAENLRLSVSVRFFY